MAHPLNTKQAAAILQVSPTTVRHYIQEGQLQAVKNRAGCFEVEISDLVQFLAQAENGRPQIPTSLHLVQQRFVLLAGSIGCGVNANYDLERIQKELAAIALSILATKFNPDQKMAWKSARATVWRWVERTRGNPRFKALQSVEDLFREL